MQKSMTQEDQAMHSTDGSDGRATIPSFLGDVLNRTADDEEQERPDDALTCPLLDTPIHFDDCKLCHGRGWVETSDISVYLGPNRVRCVHCGGEGDEESGGPVTWTCISCQGTGLMPASLRE
jgi:DnaJ-class molecular chaperone